MNGITVGLYSKNYSAKRNSKSKHQILLWCVSTSKG